MISIVGNIKIDEKDEARVKYLIACIRSFAFLKGRAEFILSIENSTLEFENMIKKTMTETGLAWQYFILSRLSYGEKYCHLLTKAKYDFILNFMEDHFCVCDDADKFIAMLQTAQQWHVDIIKATFFQVEQNSIKDANITYFQRNEFGASFWNMKEEFAEYCKFYNSRYYIGVNFITTKEFAFKFWNRDCGNRPHEYEIPGFDFAWMHKVMIPSFEVLAAVDDDHGADNSCLLKRNEEKFKEIYE